MIINFTNSYINKLGDKFYTKIYPVPVKDPKLICFNDKLAQELDINYKITNSHELSNIFSGNKILETSMPISLVYAGHQFGHFVPRLGDGRAVLLGEVTDRRGIAQDIQLKGSGKTPYSRRGDGRAAIGPMIREYIVSEAMHNLRIKTTRSLALVQTGESVSRDTIVPGAILTRVAMCHVRIGTFEYFAAKNDIASVKLLADYTIDRLYPLIKEETNSYLSLIEHIMEAQIDLVIDWIRVGFIHGVMNTDNISLSGETIDYGPCAFMDEYNYDKSFSSIDTHGRYSYGNQANILLWNLMQLFNSLKELITLDNKAVSAIQDKLVNKFIKRYEMKWLEMMGNKIGIINTVEEDRALIQSLLNIMQENELDFTLTFKCLGYQLIEKQWISGCSQDPFIVLKEWIFNWKVRVGKQNALKEQIVLLMDEVNPSIIPRNHMIEKIISKVLVNNDFNEMYEMISSLEDPYGLLEEKPLNYIIPPRSEERIKNTFCGT